MLINNQDYRHLFVRKYYRSMFTILLCCLSISFKYKCRESISYLCSFNFSNFCFGLGIQQNLRIKERIWIVSFINDTCLTFLHLQMWNFLCLYFLLLALMNLASLCVNMWFLYVYKYTHIKSEFLEIVSWKQKSKSEII